MVTGIGVKFGSNTKHPNKPVDKQSTLDPNGKLTKQQAPGKIRILNPDENLDDNITPKVLMSPPVLSTNRKISTRSVEGESRGDTFILQPSANSTQTSVTFPTQKSDDTDDEYVTEYYMEEITVTVSPEDDDGKDGGKGTGSKVKPSREKATGPRVSKKDNGFIYYHMQYIAVPVAIVLLLLVVYCLYTVEFPDRKVKFYRVRDHDPVLDGPL
jgi:hypothetical protein